MRHREYTGGALHGPSDPATSSGAEARAQEAGQELERTVRDRGERLGEHAAAMAREVREGGSELVARGRDAVAHYLASFARALGRAADSLEQDREPTPARYVRDGHRALDDWAERVRTRDPDDLAADLGALSRRQPGLALGGAALLGAMASRFLKASAERAERRRHEERHDEESYSAGEPYGARAATGTTGAAGSAGGHPGTTTGSPGGFGSNTGSVGYGGTSVEKPEEV